MTIAEALGLAERALAQAGIDGARREARLLVARSCDLSAGEIIGWPERVLAPEAGEALMRVVRCRTAREPVSRIFGSREFWSLDFALSEATLDPRPDSETLVEAALGQLPDRETPRRILDLGTGTGCLLLALLSELPNATGLGIDRSEEAARIARANAARLGLADRARFAVGDWATVPLVVSTGREQKLQFEPIALREADGRVVHGIWGLREGKPLIAMTATPIAEVLYVRIGSGFQPAIVLCDDNESDA